MTTRRAGPADAESIHALLVAASELLARQGFLNWTPPYPIDRLRRDIEEREVYLVVDGVRLVATYTLGREPVHHSTPEPWPEPELAALYLNRLAVHPERQGEGLGSWCLARIAERCRSSGASAVRCDVLAANRPLCAFYERHGYIERGRRSRQGHEFSCYELLMTSD